MPEASFYGNPATGDPQRFYSGADPSAVIPLRYGTYTRNRCGSVDSAEVFHNSIYCRYDSGHTIIMERERNKSHTDAECKDHDRNGTKIESLDIRTVYSLLDNVLPTIRHFQFPATRIMIKTVDGRHTTTVDDKLYRQFDYPLIPSHLSRLPKVSILDLDRYKPLRPSADCVKWRGEFFAFQKVTKRPRDNLHEISILHKVRDCPSIISITAIVVENYAGEARLRGFLMPFMRAGSLRDVLIRSRNRNSDVSEEDATIDWPVKLGWAFQITQGLVALHNISAYNSNLIPDSVIIDSHGIVKLADFTSTGYTGPWGPPECKMAPDTDKGPTAAVDVYMLGRLLWAAADERWDVTEEGRLPVWRKGKGKAPLWYRDVVRHCLSYNASERPPATEVLAMLESGSGLSCMP